MRRPPSRYPRGRSSGGGSLLLALLVIGVAASLTPSSEGSVPPDTPDDGGGGPPEGPVIPPILDPPVQPAPFAMRRDYATSPAGRAVLESQGAAYARVLLGRGG